jgi:hypothetical protein
MVKWKVPNSPEEEGKQTLTAERVRKVMMYVPDEDYTAMGFDLGRIHPLWLIITVLPVPPINGVTAINFFEFNRDYVSPFALVSGVQKLLEITRTYIYIRIM